MPTRMSTLPSAAASTIRAWRFFDDEAAEHLDADRERRQAALGRWLEVLLGQDGGRHQDRDLLAVLDRLEGGSQRHLGLAVAHVAADEAVHRAAAEHVGLHLLDGPRLVRRLGVRERLLQLALPGACRARSGTRPPTPVRRRSPAARAARSSHGARARAVSSAPSRCRPGFERVGAGPPA